jgi:hypothetical protein
MGTLIAKILRIASRNFSVSAGTGKKITWLLED